MTRLWLWLHALATWISPLVVGQWNDEAFGRRHGVHVALRDEANEGAVGSDGAAGPRARVGVVLTVTSDPKPGNPGYIDGAGVLAHTARKFASAKWPVQLVAVVKPEVQASRKALRFFGYDIVESRVKVKTEEIEGEELRSTIGKSGCCGMDELIKLEAYGMDQYERVLVLDSDSLLTANVDELYEQMDAPGERAQPLDVLFTNDHGLKGGCANGGFAVVRPSRAILDALWAEVKKGNYKYGSAWGGKNIGWCYGGQTYQGLIPYYFKILHKSGKAWRAVNSLVYNNMATATNDAGVKQTDARTEGIKLFHFTVCQKPWLCFYNECPECNSCKVMYHTWWAARGEYVASIKGEAVPADEGARQQSKCEQRNGPYVALEDQLGGLDGRGAAALRF
eukprot:g5635.t1